MSAQAKHRIAHVVDILGNVIGRDQPILRMDKALEMASTFNDEIFKSDDVVFFDPFCKAAELLLSCAYLTCKSKSLSNNKLLEVSEIYTEIFESGKYFALSPDERHHRLSLRTFLGNSKSHEERFNHIIRNGNYLSEIDGTLNNEIFKQEFTSMIEYIKKQSGDKKIIAIGNPPYQESDGGFGGSSTTIYNFFVEALMDCSEIDEFVMVIPSRWFTAGKGVDHFRNRIINSKQIKKIVHFPKSKTVFPTVDVLGGVCFFNYCSSYNGDVHFISDDTDKKVNFSKHDIILDDPLGYDIVEEIQARWNGKYVSDVAWSGKPFGIRTFYFSRNEVVHETDKNAIPCYTKRRKVKFANIEHLDKNTDRINEWKVAVPAAYAPGSKTGVRRVTLPINQYFIIPRGHITTETYNIVHSFKTKKEAENFISFLVTPLARYLLGLRKVTQHIPKDRWNWVPLVDAKKEWSTDSVFKEFNINTQTQKHIMKKIKEWS